MGPCYFPEKIIGNEQLFYSTYCLFKHSVRTILALSHLSNSHLGNLVKTRAMCQSNVHMQNVSYITTVVKKNHSQSQLQFLGLE